MQKILKCVAQAPMTEREWTNSNNEKRIIKSVKVTFTDGIDTFVAEATDALAEQLNRDPLETNALYNVFLNFTTRAAKTQNGEEWVMNNVRIKQIAKI